MTISSDMNERKNEFFQQDIILELNSYIYISIKTLYVLI